MHGRKRAIGGRVLDGLARRVICAHHLKFRLPGFDAVDEIRSPQFLRRHVHQMLDVYGREHGFVGVIRAPVQTLDARALAAFDDEPRDRLVREDHAVMRLDVTREGFR